VRKNAYRINHELDIENEVQAIWRKEGIRRGSVADPIMKKRNAAVRKKYQHASELLQTGSSMLPLEGRREISFEWDY